MKGLIFGILRYTVSLINAKGFGGGRRREGGGFL